MTFEQDIERDAMLVLAGMAGGFDAVCGCVLLLPGFEGGPSSVIAHGEWLRADKEYMDKVVQRVIELDSKNGS